MTDKPILFSASMVQALLEGRKTQTRRVLKPQPSDVDAAGRWYRLRSGGQSLNCHDMPFAPGDRLYVREAWRTISDYDQDAPRNLYQAPVRFESDATEKLTGRAARDGGWGRFRQGMHMPRWASRLTLTVTDVRVQRVREISDEDAESEGVLYAETEDGFVMWSGTYWTYPVPLEHLSHFPKSAFRDLWDSLNAKRGFGWDANPWVAAYTFTVETRNIDE